MKVYTRHLAELNVGRLVADTDDPRVAEFMRNLDRVNGLGKRSPGFVWMMEGEDPALGNTEAKIEGDPRHVFNLTVWESVEALADFTWRTVHRQFHTRRAEWFEAPGKPHFVMWWIPEGHRPRLTEGLARLETLESRGDTEEAFGWDHVDPDGRLRGREG